MIILFCSFVALIIVTIVRVLIICMLNDRLLVLNRIVAMVRMGCAMHVTSESGVMRHLTQDAILLTFMMRSGSVIVIYTWRCWVDSSCGRWVVAKVLSPLHTVRLGLLVTDHSLIMVNLMLWMQVQMSLISMQFITVLLIGILVVEISQVLIVAVLHVPSDHMLCVAMVLACHVRNVMVESVLSLGLDVMSVAIETITRP